VNTCKPDSSGSASSSAFVVLSISMLAILLFLRKLV
jgi:hypothetical protein